MKRSPEQTRPEFRNLRIFAIDPMVARGGDHRVTVQVRFEDLPLITPDLSVPLSVKGRRVEVVDVDASMDPAVWYKPVDLDDGHIAMQHGLEPSESDPQFHQQMVYAVATRTLEQFDRALGRVVYFRGRRRLRLVPHAFYGSNAFYHPNLRAVLFGYFHASHSTPGENLPGQTIFTCLSHDIIAHEVTHAVVDQLRPFFNVATNPQVRAFHEAFADIIAVFQRLTYRDLVYRALQDARGDLGRSPLLSNIAAQFGEGLGSGRALRSALDEKTRVQDVEEEHALGAVLVAAIFEGFQTTYDRRSADLLRIATGGSGVLPQGALHPDLVGRLASECVRTAQSVLTMCIRAFDYLPPSDVTFGAFLRALVTADWELNRLDETGLRAGVIEACRRRGIFAEEAGSLSVNALLLDLEARADWTGHESTFQRWIGLAVQINVEEQRDDLKDDFTEEDAEKAESADLTQTSPTQSPEVALVSTAETLRNDIAQWVTTLAAEELARLGLSSHDVKVVGTHPSQRITSDGAQRFVLVVLLVESTTLKVLNVDRRFYSGVTLVIDVTGQLRFKVCSKRATERWSEFEETARRAAVDGMGWPLGEQPPNPFAVNFQGMHAGRTT